MLNAVLFATVTLFASPSLDTRVDWQADFATAGDPVLLAALAGSDENAAVPGPSVNVEPDWQRRRKRRHTRRRKRRTQYRKRERTLGFTVEAGAAVPIGNTAQAYGVGPMVIGRFNVHLGDSTLLFFDIRWSYHTLQNPRPMFFRTAVTSASQSGGTLHTISPAAYFGYNIPLGYGFQNRARINPKFYFGVGPDFTIAQAFVTETGVKGTVQGEGTQAFMAFIPGLGLDIRINEFFFLGLDTRYHFTLPLARPSLREEFTIPRLYIFEGGLSLSFYFY